VRGSHRPRFTYANIVATVALVVALGGGTAAFAAVIVHSNADVAKNVISGHQPPAGAHPNLLGHTINALDLADGAVAHGKIASGAVAAVDLASDAGVCSYSISFSSSTVATKCSGPKTEIDSTHPGTGNICLRLRGFTPKGGAVTIDGSVAGFPLAYLNLAPLPAGNCPAGFNAEVTTYSALGAPQDVSFHAILF
jgi:hypothetical protein